VKVGPKGRTSFVGCGQGIEKIEEMYLNVNENVNGKTLISNLSP
jgi:hypothetical protein